MPGSDATAVVIGGRAVGPGHPVFVIAELSANHGHDIETAKAIVRAAAGAGADAVKVQTYTADSLTIDATTPPFRIGEGTAWAGRQLYDLYEEAATPWEWYDELLQLADELGMLLFSTPFDVAAVEFLEAFDPPAYKLASFELVDHALVREIARRGRPVIMSTGMATADEIEEAVEVATAAGAAGIVLLRCNSSYPAPVGQMDLRTITAMAERWDVPVGLSDHTLGSTAATVAVALGATVIEKHLTLRRADGGPDAGFSLEPDEFAAMVRGLRDAEASLGDVRFGPSAAEQPSLAFRRSLYVVEAVEAGEAFSTTNVRSIRPGGGLAPKHLPAVLERRAASAIERGTPLSWALVAD